MAEAAAKAEPEAASAGGGKKKLVLILGLVGVLALGGGAAVFLGIGASGDEAEAAKHEGGQADGKGAEHGKGKGGDAKGASGHGDGAAPPDGGAEASMDSFVVNLSNDDAQRYLKVTLKVEFFGHEVPPRFASRGAQIRDLILTLLSSKTVDDVRTVEGKAQLRDEVIARINRVLGDEVVKAIYFAEFIVQ
jgi:flagellar FliL protein